MKAACAGQVHCKNRRDLLHPAAEVPDRARFPALRRNTLRAAPTVDSDQVKTALLSFPSTSGAGPSGLRLSHIQDAMRPLGEVVSLLLQWEIPHTVQAFVCDRRSWHNENRMARLRPLQSGRHLDARLARLSRAYLRHCKVHSGTHATQCQGTQWV